jgi:hypothetical protein
LEHRSGCKANYSRLNGRYRRTRTLVAILVKLAPAA